MNPYVTIHPEDLLDSSHLQACELIADVSSFVQVGTLLFG